MKQVILNVPESQFAFFMKLVRALDFVEIEESAKANDGLSSEQKETWENIKAGFQEMEMVDKGLITSRPIQFLLNEVEN
ncbi:hypothetical protein L0657_09915 [Dyadobacter sp. CY345]|uniref:hypothetical protein n=1 Tax=Dyadobacter sp. CY345 TaxID=2909335 RepID=UPI001F4003E9|nr:hypothetical protein [Dyadobacter sp. CY345]MCF2444271.1 hypothetical protein [Dyadobacter sp. CY345]